LETGFALPRQDAGSGKDGKSTQQKATIDILPEPTQAMPMVASPSRFRSSDAAVASVRAKPSIRSKGPRTPPNKITAVSHGTSARRNGASVAGKRKAPRDR
jgi:hypothetical protein